MAYQEDQEAYTLAKTYGIAPTHETLFEIGPYDPLEDRWIRFAQPNDRTNILIKYEPDALAHE